VVLWLILAGGYLMGMASVAHHISNRILRATDSSPSK
jgi:hypothetical protein